MILSYRELVYIRGLLPKSGLSGMNPIAAEIDRKIHFEIIKMASINDAKQNHQPAPVAEEGK